MAPDFGCGEPHPAPGITGMSRIDGWLYSVRTLLWRRRADDDTRDEVAFHLERQAAKHIAAGMTPRDAWARAHREFGGESRWRLEAADNRRGSRLESILLDVRFGIRSLRHHAGFAVVAIVTLAIGIGATTTVFSAVDQILFRALPYQHADRLVELRETNDRFPQGMPFSLPNINDIRTLTHSFATIGIVNPYTLTLSRDDRAISLPGGSVNDRYFDAFSSHAFAGRLIDSGDVRPGAPPVAVLGFQAWRTLFGGDPDVVGKPVDLSGGSYLVIGIAAPGFSFPDGAQVWTACTYCRNAPESWRPNINFVVVARLAPSVQLAQARSDLARAAGVIHHDHPDPMHNQMASAIAEPLKDAVVGDASRILLLVVGAVSFVLLIGCANLASANLARNAMRRREVALRTAIGASRGRIIQQLLCESALVAVAGGLLGLAAASVMLHSIALHGIADLPRLAELGVNARTATFAVITSFLVAGAIGLVPALAVSRAEPKSALSSASQVGSTSLRGRSVLIALEMTLCIILLVGAGVAVRSLQLVLRQPLGVDPRGLLSLQPMLSTARYPTAASRVAFLDRLIGRLRATPGIIAAASASAPPLGNQWTGFIAVEGQEGQNPTGTDVGPHAGYNLVSEDFFRTIGVPLLRGRLFTPADDSLAPHVTVINQRMADLYWPGQDPIGKRFRSLSMDNHPDAWLTVVGVVGNIRYYTLEADLSPIHYVSIRQRAERAGGSSVVVRTTLAPGAATKAIREALTNVDPAAVAEIQTMDQTILETTASRRLMVNVLGGFAAVALLLAAIGIYGVLSYLVTQRRREIALRMALGAGRPRVTWMVLAEMLRPVLAGLGCGLIGARLLSHVLESLVFQIRPMDPPVIATAIGALLVLAMSAAALPAFRASRLDPMSALREE